MANLLTGSFQLMKTLNRTLILNTIRKEGPISRAEIAKRTKLTPPTVGNLVTELIEAELVLETSQGKSKGGRRPTMLIFNASHFYIIGLDIGSRRIKGVFTNLDADILDHYSLPIPKPLTNDLLIEHAVKVIEKLLEQNEHYSIERLIGIGVAMHGIIDVEKGISVFAPSLNLHNVPIKEELEKHFNIMVKVENDARALALGESWYGKGKEKSSFICINVGYGIGAGIVIDGKLLHGHDHLVGEVGHMTIDPHGPLCSCGNHGCLQALAAGPFIAKQAQEKLASGSESILTKWVEDGLELTSEIIAKGAKEGDSLCKEVLKEAGVYLGIGITNLIHIVNPSLILLGGGVIKAGAFILESLQETVQKRALTEQAKATKIETIKLGEDGTAIGAVSLLLEEILEKV